MLSSGEEIRSPQRSSRSGPILAKMPCTIIRSYKFLCKKPLRSVREAKYVTVKVLTGRET